MIKKKYLIIFIGQILFFTQISQIMAVPSKKSESPQNKINIGIIKSRDLSQFNQVVLGIQSNLSPEIYNTHIITINKSYTKESMKTFLSTKKISLLICLGEVAAVYFSKWQKKIPILFSLVLNYKRFSLLTSEYIGGVSMEISSENLFVQFRMLYSGLKSLALPYHPSASMQIVKEASLSGHRSGVKLHSMPLESARMIKKTLNKEKSKFDSIWMISDFKLYNVSSLNEVRKLFEFANDNKKPVFVSSDAFLKLGGLFSVSIDYLSLGSQLALLTNRVLRNSEKISSIGVVFPIGTRTVLNLKVAQDLVNDGILEEEVLYEYEADVIYEPK